MKDTFMVYCRYDETGELFLTFAIHATSHKAAKKEATRLLPAILQYHQESEDDPNIEEISEIRIQVGPADKYFMDLLNIGGNLELYMPEEGR